MVLNAIGPELPFGGAVAARLVAQHIGLVEGSITNPENLESLRDRTTDLLDLIMERKEALTAKKSLRGIVTRFNDVLQEIVAYAEEYSTRKWLSRVALSVFDAEHYEAIHQQLRDLAGECNLAIIADVHTLVNDVQGTLHVYVDHRAALDQMVAEAGGMGAVLASEATQIRIMEALGTAEKLTIALMKQTLSSMQADQEHGVHLLIEQPALRVFWRKLFKSEFSVRWETFWQVFPSDLHHADVSKQEIQEIEDFLGSDAARRQAFQAKVETEDPGRVSVKELHLSFPSAVPLVVRVKELAAAAGAPQADAPPRCNVPPLDPAYCGRAGVAEKLVDRLANGRSDQQPAAALCIVASAGYGKSSLAYDIARRLWESQAASGVVLVDARKVYTEREVDGAFCVALQLDQDPSDSTPKILARLRALVSEAASGGGKGPAPGAVLLVVVDNAEDPISGPGSAYFTVLLDQIQAGVPEARLLITSRQAVPDGGVGGLQVHRHVLSELRQADAEQVVRRYVDDELISDEEVAEVASVCGGVPLVLRLVADALKGGRVVIEDVRNAMATREGHKDLKVLNVLLAALPRGQQVAIAQLSMFPTVFSSKGAAAAMRCDAPKAKALLAVLLKHGLLRYSSSKDVFSLHPRVQQAASGGMFVRPDALQAAKEACALHCIENLTSWTHLYASGGKGAAYALQQGRLRHADIALLLSLLGQAEVPMHVARTLAVAATFAAFVRFLYPLCVMGLPEMVQAWRNVANSLKTKRDARLYASAISMLAWSLRTANYHSADGHAESEKLLREAVKIRTRLLTKEHVDTATALSALGSSLQMQKRSAEAEPLFREVLELSKKLKGADVTVAMANLAWSLDGLKRLDESEQLRREVLALQQKALGPEHPDTLTALRALAGCILDQGRPKDAEPLLLEALELRGKVLGPLHTDTLAVVGLLARCMADQGMYDKAAELYGNAADGWAQVAGPEHKEVLKHRTEQAACLEKSETAAAALTEGQGVSG